MATREREEILKNDEIALAIADGMARCADVFCDQSQPDRRREAARMTHKRLAESRELLAALRAERARRYAHMCRSDHVEIGFNDCVPDQPDELNCPVCFLRAEVERLRAEHAELVGSDARTVETLVKIRTRRLAEAAGPHADVLARLRQRVFDLEADVDRLRTALAEKEKAGVSDQKNEAAAIMAFWDTFAAHDHGHWSLTTGQVDAINAAIRTALGAK